MSPEAVSSMSKSRLFSFTDIKELGRYKKQATSEQM